MEEAEIELKTEEYFEESKGVFTWTKYLSLTTAIIAVVAAIASLASGSFSNEAVLEKNSAILYQNKASDQWSYYQAKGIKKNIADGFFTQFQNYSFRNQSVQYAADQVDIQKKAEDFQKEVDLANIKSDQYLEKHHRTAFAVTFFQIAIAFSALSALMRRRSFFYMSLLLAVLGVGYLVWGLV